MFLLALVVLVSFAASKQAHAKRHAPKDAIIVPVGKLPIAVRGPSEAMYLHTIDCEFTYLYLEQDQGKKLVILDITQPERIRLKAEATLDSRSAFDFVQRIGTHAVLVRYRDGSGFGILDLLKPKSPILKAVDAPASETYIEPVNLQSVATQAVDGMLGVQDYQIIDRKNAVVLETVKEVHQELSDFATGATYLLGQDGLTVVRNPRIESFILPCQFYEDLPG